MSMMPIFEPQPCDNGCCPSIYSGFCLQNGDPIAVVINSGLAVGWINLLTGAFTVGPMPPGSGTCPIPVEVTTQVEVDLSCETDSITVCQGTDPWIVSGTDFDIRPLDCATDSIEVCQGTDPWVVSGTVELGAVTLAALETITVLQGTNPWIVSATDFDIRPLDCATDSIEVCQGTSPWVVSGTVELGAATLAALETVTVLQGTSPWVVSATDLDVRPLTCETDSITVCQEQVSAVTTSVTQIASSVTLLAANPNRKGAIFWNNSTVNAWIKFGATASQTSFSIRLVSETFYELQKGYTGVVDGIFLSAGAGAMRITEFV